MILLVILSLKIQHLQAQSSPLQRFELTDQIDVFTDEHTSLWIAEDDAEFNIDSFINHVAKHHPEGQRIEPNQFVNEPLGVAISSENTLAVYYQVIGGYLVPIALITYQELDLPLESLSISPESNEDVINLITDFSRFYEFHTADSEMGLIGFNYFFTKQAVEFYLIIPDIKSNGEVYFYMLSSRMSSELWNNNRFDLLKLFTSFTPKDQDYTDNLYLQVTEGMR